MKTNWQIKELGELCDILDNKRKPVTQRDRVSGVYPYYGATGIQDYVNEYIFNEKLILIGEDGAKWGAGENTAFSVDGKYWVNNHAHVIRPHRNKVLDNWIIYFLNVNDLSESITGLTVQKLNQGKLREIKIPLPSVDEQKKILKILDETFEKIEKVKENTEKNLKNARALFDSYLNNIFVNPEASWKERKLKEVCTKLFAGGDVPKNNFSKVKNNKYNIPIFANGFKNKGLFGYTNIEKVIDPSITISARGTIGYSEIREESFFPVVRLIVLIPDTKIVDLRFLYYMTHNFKFSNTGTSIPQLTIPMIENIIIPIPDIKEQKNIITKLDNLSVETKKLEASYKQKLADLEELKKSVLKKAFNGEL